MSRVTRVNPEEPRVAIIILNWNGLEDTIECLESLAKVTYPNYEVVLVDNGSKGNDVRILREKFGDYIYMIVNDKNYGFAEGTNIGMRHVMKSSCPDYVLLLNNDVVVDPNFLTELVQVAESNSQTGIVGAKVYFYAEPNKIQSAGGRINWWAGETPLIGCLQIDRGQFDETKEVDWVMGGALLIRCETIEEIGLLYAGYFGYFEETEWCAKAKKAGYKVIYTPRARLWHKREPAVDRIDGFRLYYMTRNRFLFMKRNATRVQSISFFVQFFLRHFPLTLVWLLVRRKDVKLLPRYFKGIYDGIGLMLKA
jgi:GT2 family glycosyltransferase